MVNSEMMLQIKKERLDRHLEEVERLIREWIGQLSAPDPFAHYTSGHVWGWQSAYMPPLEQDPDSNHMLRRHLRSRALWIHHSGWERSLARIYELLPSANEEAGRVWKEKIFARRGSTASNEECNKNYIGTALWQAFSLALKKRPGISYAHGEGGNGVRLGAYLIDPSARAKDFGQIKATHYRMSGAISKLPVMREIAREWKQVLESEGRMRTIATRAVRSSDLLYPCRFCKHLWRV